MTANSQNAENARLKSDRDRIVHWKKWGPYLSERQWGTVREDYSHDGDAWNYFSHDQSRSRAYRWGEDGLGGISDDRQSLCFALALWNGKDAIIKERLFGLTNTEGNHGEDVKEYYFYLDSTPTHSYMKYLYKYPQAEFPYGKLIENNRSRSRKDFEYELIDTGVFDEDRYFDVFVEYAKHEAEDILIQISVYNRGPEAHSIEVLPTLWFRNTWFGNESAVKPMIRQIGSEPHPAAHAQYPDKHRDYAMADYYFYCDRPTPLLFTENETNNERIFGTPNSSPYVKDGINNYITKQQTDAVNPAKCGTKVAAHYKITVPAGGCEVVRVRLSAEQLFEPMKNFDHIMSRRIAEADEFYADLLPEPLRADKERYAVTRQSLAGMMWSKQFFYYDVDEWLREHSVDVMSRGPRRGAVRNSAWYHMFNNDVISMPDKWEYPWYAAWDLAFHVIPLNIVDPYFAKEQLDLMLSSAYLHPNGQIPAYEWNFGDVNPPVHAFATYHAYLFDKAKNEGRGDIDFLQYAFSKLLLNFTWWINRKDPSGHNVFDGGFLGLDNIGVFDRSSALPTGGYLEQADGTAWMVFFSQQMLNIALELAQHSPVYERFALKFLEHTFWIASAMDRPGSHRDELWDEEDGFFYDVLRFPNGTASRLKVRSMVGLLPLCSAVVFDEEAWNSLPRFKERSIKFVERQKQLGANIHMPTQQGVNGRRMLAVCDEQKLRRILSRVFDENEFLSPYGIRSLSKYHQEHPFVFHYHGQEFRVDYEPGESSTGLFGGNSNWRGPIWMPVNFLIIRALLHYYGFYGNEFQIEYPTGSGQYKNLFEISNDLMSRICNIFLKDEAGKRAIFGGTTKFQNDPHWRDLHLFYEYFQGDNGAGLGASHQTGWTGIISMIMFLQSTLTEETWLSPMPMRNIARLMHG